MPQVTWTAQAEADVEEIDLFLSRRSPTAANRVTAGIDTTCRRLAASPGMGRPRPDLGPGIRSFPTRDGYIVYYVPTDAGIEVQRVQHGARQVDSSMYDT